MKLPPGKIPIDILQNTVFKNLGANRAEVTLGPTAGVDGAVLDIGDKSVIVSMDPITGAIERIGFEAVNVNANDIATFGVKPAFIFSCIMLPENADNQIVETISAQMGKAAMELGVAIVGGHCETTPNLVNPIVVCCIMGLTNKGEYITTAGVKNGDYLILTKSAGIEGVAILATDREEQLSKVLSSEMLQTAKDLYKQISVVKDALTAYQTGGVHAMHDPTEGGVLNGIHEMADAANLGVRVFEEKIVVNPETREICQYFKIDPLQLISSGALLIAAEPKASLGIIEILKQQGISAAIIGEFNDDSKKRVFELKTGDTQVLPRPVSDQLWTALSR
ncbi:MAG: AIR synthase family protein [Candidatus Bathyarchaeota archaeon]|nr:AIR synthase family protein [Candidatus Termiticorpusculum sp.]MCL1971306.1 AIR synthase family protein [Candidatus Termiticorpusculum sp.]